MDRNGAGESLSVLTEQPTQDRPARPLWPRPAPAWFWGAWMAALVAIPAVFVLRSVKIPAELTVSPNSTPYGYTWSLLLFLVPLAVLALWLWMRPDLRAQREAVVRVLPLLVAQGFALDILFGHRFLLFDNLEATLGWQVPVVGGTVPVEEFIFYASGFTVVLLMYIWCDEIWLARYNDEDYSAGVRRAGRLLRFHKESLFGGLFLYVLAVAYKQIVAQEAGLPEYFSFLVVVAFVPSLGFFRAIKPYVNWQAVSLTFFVVAFVSLLWEVTLAIPYGWWGYRQEVMMGIRVGAWGQLPIEAVLVWIAVTYSTIIWYEVFKIWKSSGEKARSAFLAQ